jgi:hypothetical protein
LSLILLVLFSCLYYFALEMSRQEMAPQAKLPEYYRDIFMGKEYYIYSAGNCFLALDAEGLSLQYVSERGPESSLAPFDLLYPLTWCHCLLHHRTIEKKWS